MASIAVAIAAGTDDAHEAQDGNTFSSNGNAIIMSARTSFANLRFVGGFRIVANIPSEAVITSATLTVTPLDTSNDDAAVDIYCEAVDDSVDFSTTADVTSRARTTASTGWAQDGLGTSAVTSPNFSSAVQEVIDRAGWAEGNALTVLVVGRSNVTKPFQVHAFESTGAEATVTVEWVVPEPGRYFRRRAGRWATYA